MKLFSDIRLLLLALWLGAAVFFIAVAQSAFTVLPQRELAGAVVNRTLSILNVGGMAFAVILILTSFLGTRLAGRFGLWLERLLLLAIAVACAVGQFVVGFWLASIRAQIGKPIDEVATDDPLRLQFNTLHTYSEWLLMAAMVAALLAFFIIANRKFVAAKEESKSDVYDFSKEFKV